MNTIAHPQPEVNRSESRAYEVWARTRDLKCLERCRFADTDAFAAWLVSRQARYHGRAGFSVQVNGQTCYLTIQRADVVYRWQHIQEQILPAFHRAERLAALPKLVPMRRKVGS